METRLALLLLAILTVLSPRLHAQWTSTACAGVTIQATTSSGMAGQPDCAGIVASLIPGGWDGASSSGYIRYTWPSAISSVRIEFYSVNTNDYATVTTNGGGALTITSVGTCSSVSGTVIGPYLGGGSYGTVAYNVSATIPFTMLNVLNTGGSSGWVSDCPVNVILATELASFSLRSERDGLVRLDWQSTYERNSDHYAVERSADAVEWEEIGQVRAVPNSDIAQAYAFTDAMPLPGRNLYRLRAIARDGSYSQSGAKEAFVANYIKVFPNPSKGELNVLGISDPAKLALFDHLGRAVEVPILANGTGLLLDMAELENGMYILRLNDQGETLTRKVWKE